MKKVLSFCYLVLISLAAACQTVIPLTDNMDFASNSWIQLQPGNYNLSDPGHDGLIRINNKQNVIIDGDGVYANGVNYGGYMIKINNSDNVKIRNFTSASHYKYAVYITNSKNIQINGCDFSYNKVDSSGWIDVWSDYTAALGGGVMMNNVDTASIFDNIMKWQNDGVALYHCDSISLSGNDFSWNTSYGIRMFFTDSCDVHDNICSHVNRPLTDPSDCAALLLIVSNGNRVVNNDLSYSGDGVFLGQYNYSQIPNNNYFAWNECSYSPHNAIEATFADGNVYVHNLCNYSHYGLWLGYSYNTILDSNEVIGNQHSGIAVDRGFNNKLTGNMINDNPIGLELWEGSAIAPYQNQFSKDYTLLRNTFQGNTVAVSAISSEYMLADSNSFLNNSKGIHFEGVATADTLRGNTFSNSTTYHLENYATSTIFAPGNSFVVSDSALIDSKIYDKHDNTSKGLVNWYPPLQGIEPVFQFTPLSELTEPPAEWYAYPEVCPSYGNHQATSVSYDPLTKMEGDASLHLSTGNGWDIALNYRPGGDTIVKWNLSEQDTLIFWVRTIKNTDGFQFFSVRLGGYGGGYFKYTASASLLNAANLTWKKYKFPLSGNSTWTRSKVGEVSLSAINYVEVHADTYGAGFDLWLDGLHFSPLFTGSTASLPASAMLSCSPNPVKEKADCRFTLTEAGFTTLALYDLQGTLKAELYRKWLSAGLHEIVLDTQALQPGIYLLRLSSVDGRQAIKMVVSH